MKIIGIALLLIMMASGSLWGIALMDGPEEEVPVTDRFFFGITAYKDSFKGDFDGNLVLGNAAKVFFVPKLSSQHGFGLSFGRRLKSGLWSISYLRAAHETTFRGIKGESTSNIIDVNGKAYLFRKLPVLPYILLGFTVPWITVKDGAVQGYIPYDATYWGLGVNAGAGLAVPITKRLFFTAGFAYKFMGFMFITGPGKGKDVTNLYVDQYGSRREKILRMKGLNFEFGIGINI